MVGFDLATRDPTRTTVGAYDAPAHGITGVAFDIEGNLPVGRVRALVTTAENDSDAAYWDGAQQDVSPFHGPGHYEIRWPEVGGPLYLGRGAPPFDPTKIEAIVFHVVGNIAPVSYDFCINNVMLLTN